MHPLRWHLMMLLLSGLLYYSPQGLYHWDFGWIALAVNTIQTNKQFQPIYYIPICNGAMHQCILHVHILE